MPQYMLKLPQGANIDTQMANGTQPNQDFGKIFTKIKNPNPFFEKSPILRTLTNFLHNL